ncbi:MAG: PIN domain-containing protein [Bacteroidales bacterium]|nr:PIN domain-containing protein [Bacteroidales bacterium]
MNLIVDTNIIISGLITPKGTITDIIFNKLEQSNLVSPSFMFEELQNKFNKILKITGYSDKYLTELLFLICKRIEFIDDDLISFKNQGKAYQIVQDIDKKDLLFVALSLQTGYDIWTGDFKLINGLKQKGFLNILSTNDLIKRIER